MKTINREKLKKYALDYLNKYASSKKNLEMILLKRIKKYVWEDKESQKQYHKEIMSIINELEKNNIINDEIFADSKIFEYLRLGKSNLSIRYNLLKKGINKECVDKIFIKLKNENPDYELEAAIIFAKKKKLDFGDLNNKDKNLSKMARAGFNYGIALKVLGYD